MAIIQLVFLQKNLPLLLPWCIVQTAW